MVENCRFGWYKNITFNNIEFKIHQDVIESKIWDVYYTNLKMNKVKNTIAITHGLLHLQINENDATFDYDSAILLSQN